MVSYTPQFKHKNNQKVATACAERCLMLYVPMCTLGERKVHVTHSVDLYSGQILVVSMTLMTVCVLSSV